MLTLIGMSHVSSVLGCWDVGTFVAGLCCQLMYGCRGVAQQADLVWSSSVCGLRLGVRLLDKGCCQPDRQARGAYCMSACQATSRAGLW